MAELARYWFYCPKCIYYNIDISEEPIVDKITHRKTKPSHYEEEKQ